MSATYYAEHPDPAKKGTNIDREKYEQMHTALVTALSHQPSMSLKEMTVAAKDLLAGQFDGSFEWYVTTVKLDMEAKNELICDRKQSPHQHRLA